MSEQHRGNAAHGGYWFSAEEILAAKEHELHAYTITISVPTSGGVASIESTWLNTTRTHPTLSAQLGYLKHGPGGSGNAGSCDPGCAKCAAERTVRTAPAAHDPLDRLIDGVTLRVLVQHDRYYRHEGRLPSGHNTGADGHVGPRSTWTPAQRAAVSAHWSVELRAKVAASAERERCAVVLEQDADDLPPWGSK